MFRWKECESQPDPLRLLTWRDRDNKVPKAASKGTMRGTPDRILWGESSPTLFTSARAMKRIFCGKFVGLHTYAAASKASVARLYYQKSVNRGTTRWRTWLSSSKESESEQSLGESHRSVGSFLLLPRRGRKSRGLFESEPNLSGSGSKIASGDIAEVSCHFRCSRRPETPFGLGSVMEGTGG